MTQSKPADTSTATFGAVSFAILESLGVLVPVPWSHLGQLIFFVSVPGFAFLPLKGGGLNKAGQFRTQYCGEAQSSKGLDYRRPLFT